MRCDGVGGIVGRKFLYEVKRMVSDEDSPLERPWIDLNKLANWGNKGILYGDRSDRFLDTVPFEVGKGGRIEKFAEDKLVDVEMYADERNFSEVIFQIIERHGGQIQFPERVSGRTEEGNYSKDYMIEDAHEVEYIPMMWGDVQISEEELDETVGTIVEDVIEDMEKKIYEQEKERVLGQVNLRLAEMQLENMEADEKGERRAHALDNMTRLNIFFKISGDQRHMSEVQVRHEGTGGCLVEEELQNLEETGEEESVKEGVEEDDVMEMVGMEVTVEMENVGETGEGEDFVTGDEKGEDSDRVLDEGLALEADLFSQDMDEVFDEIVKDLDEMFAMKKGEMERKVNKFGGCILFDV